MKLFTEFILLALLLIGGMAANILILFLPKIGM